jgi:16S rRNA G966 N2-methylase RsmD
MLILYDYISLYTSNKQASQMLYILKKYCNKNYTIVDANAGMGGNSIFFCKYFKFVYCIDISDQAINHLNHNLKEFENKYIINNDCLEILKIINFDVVFFDPPWGGPDYKLQKSINLYINNINIYDIIEHLYNYKNLKIICLKAPRNFLIKYDISWNLKIYNIYKSDNKSILFKFIIFKK